MEQLLQQLVSIESVSGDESAISEYIHAFLCDLGITTSRVGNNVIGFIPGTNNNKCLILSGHIDTVAYSRDAWDTNPLVPTIVDGELYGLGASDMKAGVAVIMQLAQDYSWDRPACDVYFAFVCNEEIDGAGTREFLEWFKDKQQAYEVVEAIIAEPSNATELEIGHRGNYFIDISLHSESGHASLPQAIKNPAIKQAKALTDALGNQLDVWKERYHHPTLGNPSLAFTGAWGGDLATPNKITGEVLLRLDIRTTPEMHANVLIDLQVMIEKLDVRAEITKYSQSPVGWTSEQSNLRRLFKARYPSMPQIVMTGSADLCFFTEAKIPTVVFGPGQKNKMHQPNESVELVKLGEAYVIIDKIASDYAA